MLKCRELDLSFELQLRLLIPASAVAPERQLPLKD